MVLFPIHILANPLALVLAALDSYALTAMVYLIAKRLLCGDQWRWHPALERIVTSPAQFVERRLTTWRTQSVPGWQPWV